MESHDFNPEIPSGRAASAALPVGGFTPFTTVDYPGTLAAVVFTQGCPLRCRYCHNAHLRPFSQGTATWSDILEKLHNRIGWLEGVVFSGGEPTCHPALPAAMDEVKALGFKVGLHTSGTLPHLLEKALPYTDWVGLDIKAPFDKTYDTITGSQNSWPPVSRSLDLILASGVAHQLRTTVHPSLLSEQDIQSINHMLDSRGASPTIVQPFRPQGCSDEHLCAVVS